jgi:hypothetical protein
MELKTYKPIPKKIKAIQYDGSDEMDEFIEKECAYSWIEYDEASINCGLHVFYDKPEYSKSKYCVKGDYLMLQLDDAGDVWYKAVDQFEFESKYERDE